MGKTFCRTERRLAGLAKIIMHNALKVLTLCCYVHSLSIEILWQVEYCTLRDQISLEYSRFIGYHKDWSSWNCISGLSVSCVRLLWCCGQGRKCPQHSWWDSLINSQTSFWNKWSDLRLKSTECLWILIVFVLFERNFLTEFWHSAFTVYSLKSPWIICFLAWISSAGKVHVLSCVWVEWLNADVVF